jgi:hypothetical protein
MGRPSRHAKVRRPLIIESSSSDEFSSDDDDDTPIARGRSSAKGRKPHRVRRLIEQDDGHASDSDTPRVAKRGRGRPKNEELKRRKNSQSK